MKRCFENTKRIVVKVGTTTITKPNAMVDEKFVAGLARQVSRLKRLGKEIIIVSSGAIGLGVKELGLKEVPRSIVLRQACAAIGQSLLMGIYAKAFKRFRLKVAQVLLTYDAFSKRTVYLNLKSSLNKLLALGVIPIVNENDAIAIDEIDKSFGDNDKLSALVASKLDAQLLILLSDVPGLFERDPKRHVNARVIKTVERVSRDIEFVAGKRGSVFGRGGMAAKINAAKIAVKSNADVVIACGREKNVLLRILAGEEIGTLFLKQGAISSKERWISFSAPSGAVSVDAGAKKALLSNKSLLPKGVVSVSGAFEPKEIVSIQFNGKEFARGQTDYGSEELNKIKGLHSSEVKKALGYSKGSVIKTENIIIL